MNGERDKASENPYEAPRSRSESDPEPRWPLRLAAALFLLPIYVLLLQRASQLRHSTGRYDHINAMGMLLPVIPFFVLIPVLAASTLRWPKSSALAKRTAAWLLVAFGGFTAWVWYSSWS